MAAVTAVTAETGCNWVSEADGGGVGLESER